MNLPGSCRPQWRGMTLIEMSLVIFVLITLMCTGLFFSSQINTWRAGREAAEILRTVYAAQRMYLADNPTVNVGTISTNTSTSPIIAYLPNRATTLPTAKSLTNATLTPKVNVTPPVWVTSAGAIYDPSGNSKDSLWDVGE